MQEERAIKGKLRARSFKDGAAAKFLIKMRDNFSAERKSAAAVAELIINPKRAHRKTERFISEDFFPAEASETIFVTARLSPDKERVIAKEKTLHVREYSPMPSAPILPAENAPKKISEVLSIKEVNVIKRALKRKERFFKIELLIKNDGKLYCLVKKIIPCTKNIKENLKELG